MNRAEKFFGTLVVVGGFALGTQSIQPVQASTRIQPASAVSQGGIAREYRGIKLGMKKEEVRSKLGKPETSEDASDDFKLGGEDTMTVRYEGDAVRAIQVAILDPKNAPAWKEIVGDAEINEMANGAKAARQTLAEEKLFVSMYQNKEGTITRITISRM